MDGAGNDFIVIDNRFLHFSDDELSAIANYYCPRRTGIGADGLIALNHATSEGAHFQLRYFNADGTVGMCGNGARCLVWFAHLSEITPDRYVVETDSGIYEASIEREGVVKLFVPDPHSYKPNIPLNDCLKIDEQAAFIWTGTDHTVMFVDDLEKCDVLGIGRAIRYSKTLAPKGANVNFVSKGDSDADEIRVRTYERGVEDETLACGTGAMATAIVSVLEHKVSGTPVTVRMPGGSLHVDFDIDGDGKVTNVSLEGPAKVTFRGSIQLAPETLKGIS